MLRRCTCAHAVVSAKFGKKEVYVARVRRNLDLHPKTVSRVERIKDELEATSDAEVIRRAIQLFDALLNDEAKGKVLYVMDPETGDRAVLRIRPTGYCPPDTPVS
jgi:hypothetical protein